MEPAVAGGIILLGALLIGIFIGWLIFHPGKKSKAKIIEAARTGERKELSNGEKYTELKQQTPQIEPQEARNNKMPSIQEIRAMEIKNKAVGL